MKVLCWISLFGHFTCGNNAFLRDLRYLQDYLCSLFMKFSGMPHLLQPSSTIPTHLFSLFPAFTLLKNHPISHFASHDIPKRNERQKKWHRPSTVMKVDPFHGPASTFHIFFVPTHTSRLIRSKWQGCVFIISLSLVIMCLYGRRGQRNAGQVDKWIGG